MSNPLSVIQQLTFLLFVRRLNDVHLLEESKAEDPSIPMQRRVFLNGAYDKGKSYANLRWSRFKNFEAQEKMRIVDELVFPSFVITLLNSMVALLLPAPKLSLVGHAAKVFRADNHNVTKHFKSQQGRLAEEPKSL